MNLLWHELDSSSSGRILITGAGRRGGLSAIARKQPAHWTLEGRSAGSWAARDPQRCSYVYRCEW